jgi:imidazole glycerol-phosphate synthase subunit HisH
MIIGVIDYGVGNLGSVARAITELNNNARLISHPNEIKNVDKLILPGVGNFTDCSKRLENNGWKDALNEEVKLNNKPLLGICLGMQLLASMSTEGTESSNSAPSLGLDLIPGSVHNLSDLGCTNRIPHVGWNSIFINARDSEMFKGIQSGTDFYFVHSFVFLPNNKSDIIATTEYGYSVTAAVRRGNIWGTQFHPEKSSRAGFKLLNNFIQSS